jgi:hypothetical protein
MDENSTLTNVTTRLTVKSGHRMALKIGKCSNHWMFANKTTTCGHDYNKWTNTDHWSKYTCVSMLVFPSKLVHTCLDML